MGGEVAVHVRWTDLDAYGHVHHARQLILIEDARNRWIDSVFGEQATWDYAVVRVAYDYRSQLGYEPEGALCSFSVVDIGRSSVRLAESLRRRDGEVVTEGESVIVAWDQEEAVPRALTEDERDLLGGESPIDP